MIAVSNGQIVARGESCTSTVEVLPMIGRTAERAWTTSLRVLVACAALLDPGAMPAAAVAVRHTEGLVHGFLVLRTVAGDTLADGDLIQVARGDRVTSRLVFRFKDGSLHDETAVFSQRHNFRLLSDHLVEKDPAVQHPMEVSIDGFTGQVTVRSTGDDGKEKVVTGRFDLPPDVVNGLVLTLLKNIRSDERQTKVSMVAATPKPRLVKLAISPQGEDLFSIGGASRKATHYVAKWRSGELPGWWRRGWGSNPRIPRFGFSVERLRPSSNRRARFTSVVPFGGLTW